MFVLKYGGTIVRSPCEVKVGVIKYINPIPACWYI